jgi:hypothetical protein
MEVPGQFSNPHHPSQISTLTGADGRFQLESIFDGIRIIAVHEFGWANVPITGADQTIILNDWGRVQGKVMAGAKPLPKAMVSIGSGWDHPERLGFQFRTQADERGNFLFPQVPGGTAQVCLLSQSPDGGGVYNHPTPVEVKAGETSTVNLGGVGVTITGKIVLVPVRSDINWHKSSVHLSLKRPSPIEYMGEIPPQTYGTFPKDDGSFKIQDILPGNYRLSCSLEATQARVDQIGNTFDVTLGILTKDVIVGTEDVDLAVLEVALVPGNN